MKKYINVEYIIANELKTRKRRELFLFALQSTKDDRRKKVCDRMKDVFEGKVVIEKSTIK